MEQSAPLIWPQWYRVVFRFCFLYFGLYIFLFPIFDYFGPIAFLGYLPKVVGDWSVTFFNEHIYQIKETLVPLGGSGDTSFAWAQLAMIFCISIIGCIIWSILDRRRKSYYRAEYFMRTAMRYFVALFAFSYGSVKLLALQMPFPTLSMLATPLGDYLPMRLSWIFLGYSAPYQIFSGVMEILVAFLLLNRKTVTLGLIIGLGVFANVLMINLCYDVPVKIFSFHLTLIIVALLANDFKRLAAIFIFNKPAEANRLYHYQPTKRPSKVIRLVLKSFFILMLAFLSIELFPMYTARNAEKIVKPIAYGYYDVVRFVKNGRTIPILANDSLVWKDMIFEYDAKFPYVSVGSADTIFSQRYRRGSFEYSADTVKKELSCFRFKKGDSIHLFTFRYDFIGRDTVSLKSTGRDSLELTIVRNNRKFKLAEKQFHWLSESNR